MCLFFFFFRQKTAYEMRISDGSSDVCSSDLLQRSGVADPIIDALPHSACGNDFLLAHDGQMLRQCRLAEANTQLELTDAKLSFGELAKDHEPPLVRKHAQQIDRKSTRLNSSH